MHMLPNAVDSDDEDEKPKKKTVKTFGAPDVVGIEVIKKLIAEICAHVMMVRELNESQELFAVDFFLNLRWNDSSLIGLMEDKGAEGTVKLEGKWTPKVSFLNNIEVEQTFVNDRLVNSKMGTVERDLRYSGIFYNDFELRAFPFDSQVLEVQIVFYENFELRKHPNRTLAFTRINTPEWEKVDITTLMDSATGSDGVSSQVYKIRLHVKRIWNFYVYQAGLSIFLLTLLAFSSFFLPPKELADRMGIILTLLLTIVAFRITISSSLPKTPYLTILDTYTLLSFVLATFAGVENVFVSTVHKDMAKEIDDWCKIVFPTAWLIAQFVVLFFTSRAKQIAEKERKFFSLKH